MKEIKATIQPHMLSHVIRALHELPHFPGVTLFKCEGHGRGRGEGGAFVTTEDTLRFQAKQRLEIVCADDQVEVILDVIIRHARTGHPGSGIIAVTDITHVVRIGTGETAERAV